jgi:Zn-finger nucleic acid-binding protein
MVGRMLCPVDNTVLQMTDRQGVEIDYCPQCRGVWLDRGELDKIIDRNPGAQPPAPASVERPRDERGDQEDRGHRDDRDYRDHRDDRSSSYSGDRNY